MSGKRCSVTVEKDGRQYFAYREDLPGVYGAGASIAEAKKSICEAVRLYRLHAKKGRGSL
jgi:predicted RNase H-like HicB family nuclease